MVALSDPDPLFERLMVLNRAAFDAAHYNTAYHVLAAALHEAYARSDDDQLALVQRIAAAQLAGIDRDAPVYAHSTSSATARGRTSIFTLLVRQAHTKMQLTSLASRKDQSTT